MKYQYLGSTGLKICSISLGAQTFGWSVDEKESKEILNFYNEAGGNYIDAADSYNYGESEQIVGNWMKDRKNRDSMIVGTKVFFATGKGPNDSGLSRKHIFQSVEESLKRLGTDYIDLYQMHCQDNRTPIEESLRAMDDLVASGKVRYLGASNLTPSRLQKGLMLGRQTGRGGFAALQLEYSLLVRSPEWELLPLCRDEGVGTVAWSPLAGGWLSGKYRRGLELPPDSRAGKGERWDDGESQRGGKKTFDIIDLLVKIGEEVGKPSSQVALNWLLQGGWVSSVLTGARTVTQLRENLGAGEWSLSADHQKALNAVSEIGMPYPYSFIDKYSRR
jgi:aryl-alcohol dehydrogenase-like predicted oxidoreductase